jgi:hypothetical protein
VTEPERTTRRRRRSATSPQGAPPDVEPAPTPQPPTPAQRAPSRKPRRQQDTGEHGLHDLVGAGHSQLGVTGALRGRDVNRPSDEDLAEAERETTIVRRHWVPAEGH